MIRANVLDRFLDPFGAFLTPEVARNLVDFRVDEQTQARIDELADKCNEGQLTPAEREEYDTYISVSISSRFYRQRLARFLSRRMVN